MTSVRSSMLSAVFQALDQMEIPWSVLHGYDGFPHDIPGDVDLIVFAAREAATRLAAALVDQGILLVGVFEEPSLNHYCIFAQSNGGWWEYLHVDLHERCHFGGHVVLPAEEVLTSRRRHRGIWVPAPAVELAYVLSKRLTKGKVGDEAGARLQFLLSEDPEAGRAALARLFGRKGRQLNEALLLGRIEWIRANAEELRQELSGRPRFPLARWLPWPLISRAVRRLVHPNGVAVAVLGLDGPESQDVLIRTAAQLAPYHGVTGGDPARPELVRYVRHRPGTGLPGLGNDEWMADGGPQGMLASSVRLVSYLATAIIRHLTVVWPWRVGSRIVLLDGHFCDILNHPGQYGYSCPPWLAKFCSRLVPDPDLTVLMDRRSPTGQRALQPPVEYRRIDGSQPPGAVAHEIAGATLKHLSQRHFERLGIQLQDQRSCEEGA